MVREKNKKRLEFFESFSWLAYKDSNLDKQNQNLLCYHYTISQYLCAMDYFQKRCKDKAYFYIYQIFAPKNKYKNKNSVVFILYTLFYNLFMYCDRIFLLEKYGSVEKKKGIIHNMCIIPFI